MKQFVSTLIILSMIAVPVIILAEDAGSACMLAQSAAKQDANGTLWFLLGLGGGCIGSPLLGLLTLILGYSLNAPPPATALLGKSPEYVAVYTDCYAKEVKSTRGNNALYGCLTGGGLWTVGCISYYLLVLAAYGVGY